MPADLLRSTNKSTESPTASVNVGQTVCVLIETNREATQWTLAFLAEDEDLRRGTESHQQHYRVHFGKPDETVTVPADRVDLFATHSDHEMAQDCSSTTVIAEVSSIYDLEEHPRERLWRSGPESLSDAEVIALLIDTSQSAHSAPRRLFDLELAREVIAAKTGLAELTQMNDSIVRQLGKAKATKLFAALEFSRRLARAKVPRRELLDRPDLVASYLTLRYSQSDQEVMGALYLDMRNRLIAEREIFRGTLGRAAVEPRAILKEGLLRSAAGFVVWHTHPSGEPTPSKEDLSFTRRLADAADLLGVRLLDHMILGSSGRWVSLGRRGAW